MKAEGLERMASRIAAGPRTVRTAGKIEFIRDQGPLRRNIRAQGFNWDPDIHRNLAKTLWAVERAHSYAMAGLRLFSKMSSSDFSPDGLLGGVGYIQKVKDLRSTLSQAVEVLSGFADTMHDEVNADHWRQAADDTTEEIISEAVQPNPEKYVEQQFQQEVPSADEGLDAYRNPEPDDFNPFVEGDGEDDEDDNWWSQPDGMSQQASSAGGTEVPEPGPKSALPTDEGEQGEAPSLVERVVDTVGGPPRGNYATAIGRLVEQSGRLAAFRRSGDPVRIADSSVDPATLPGPRIMHLDPHSSPEPMGGWSDRGEVPSDDPSYEGFFELDHIYQGPDANNDGVTGYDNTTDGDVTTFKSGSVLAMARRVAENYSWLPGSRNEKLMPYYDRDATPEDVAWMRAHDSPDPPSGMSPRPVRPERDPLWDYAREIRGDEPTD